MFEPTALIYMTLALLLAATIKGAIGIGLPTASVALLTLTFPPRTAIALILIPMLLSNGWQVYRQGMIPRTAKTYLPFALSLAVGVWITVLLSHGAPDRLLFALLGVAILIFVLVSATAWAPKIPDWLDRRAQIGFGGAAGIMGGLTAVWGPPLAAYLTARHVPKDEFVRASGFLIFVGSLPLIAGYLHQGFLTGETALLSVGLLVPTFAGFALGESLRHRLSEQGFRRLVLFLFFLMGLNLLRRALI